MAPAKSIEQMQQVIFNDYLDAALAGFFIVVLLSVLGFGIRTIRVARAAHKPSAHETPFEKFPAGALPA